MYLFSKPVSFESFWLRIHQPPQAYKNQEFDTRFLIVMNGEQIVSKTVVQLWSDEWYLVTPRRSEMQIGDRLIIEAGTDLDSLTVQWGQVIPTGLAQQNAAQQGGKTNAFAVYQVVEKTPAEIAQ